jgi:hypothetical protein
VTETWQISKLFVQATPAHGSEMHVVGSRLETIFPEEQLPQEVAGSQASVQVQTPVASTVPFALQVTAFEYWHVSPANPAVQVLQLASPVHSAVQVQAPVASTVPWALQVTASEYSQESPK